MSNKTPQSYRFVLFFVLLCAIAYEVTSLMHVHPRTAVSVEKTKGAGIDIREKRREIANLFDTNGPGPAYARFIEIYRTDIGNQHSVSHIVGETLYDRLGIAGIAVCDSTFSFGCYHGFFGHAVTKEGLSIIPKLDAACQKKRTEEIGGCQHGLGHGIVSYLGYGKLPEALSQCRFVSYRGAIGGCTSGVFMEYNLHTMDDPSGRTFRALTSGRPYEPCDDVSEQFRQACYYELPQWWEKVYGREYGKIGELCQGLISHEEKSACFRGAGNIVKFATEYDIPKAMVLCSKMGSSEGELLCRKEAYVSFSSTDPVYLSKPDMFCGGLESGAYYSCLTLLTTSQ